MNILKTLGAIIYSVIVGYLIWLLFYFIDPLIMQYGWGMVCLFIILGTTLIGLTVMMFSAISIPIRFLVKNNFARIFTTIIILFFAYSTIMLPWRFDIEYKFVKIILAICLDFCSLPLIAMNIISIWTKDN